MPWISELYALVTRAQGDAAVDLVFERFDTLLHEGRILEADQALDVIDVRRLDSNLLVAVLVITRLCRDELRCRDAFLDRAERTLRSRMPERGDELLDGLRSWLRPERR